MTEKRAYKKKGTAEPSAPLKSPRPAAGTEAKPSRRLYDLLLERLPDGLEASQCLYVGNDMRNDIAPAAAVGMKTALFAGDRRSLRLREGDPLTEGVSPDLVVTHLHQILECLG